MTQFGKPSFPGVLVSNERELRQFDKDLVSVLERLGLDLQSILDRGISFDDNVDVSRVSVTSHGTPGTEFSVAHLLGKVPTGYIVTGQAGAGSVYDGATTSTKTTLYLKSDAASTVFRLMVF